MTTRQPACVLLFLLISLLGYGQSWQQNDNIFNPSGIPSLPFSQPRLADLDGDGDQDLILGSISGRPGYFENIGSSASPHFQTGPELFASVEVLDCEVGVCTDLDADGDLDFITGGYTGLQLYDNVGDSQSPVFEKIPDFFADLSVGSNPVPSLADLDGDGDQDLVVGYSESGAVRYYQNLGTAQQAIFLESESETWFDVGLYAYPWLSDLDHDGDFDLLVGRDGYNFYFYRNTGNTATWTWTAASSLFAGLGQDTYWNSPCLADLTGDGLQELIFGTAAGPLHYAVNTGTAAVPEWTANSSLFGGVLDVGGASNPVFFDWDSDGDLDLFSGSALGSIKYYENTGNVWGPAWTPDNAPFSNIDHSLYSAVAVGDLDADGLPDLVVGDLSGNLFFHHNTGTGFSYQADMFTGINLGGWSSPRLYDLDYDQDLDLVIGRENGTISYYENTGNATVAHWTADELLFSGIDVGNNAVISLGDVNLDRNLDLITGDLFHEIQAFSLEHGSWVEHPELVNGLTAGQNATPALADLNGDGDLDLTVGNYDGTFNYYENLNIVSIVEPKQQPQHVRLDPAFPNPFNPSTTISYGLTVASNVSLCIYDISGRVIKQLINGAQQASAYRQVWDGQDSKHHPAPAGVYLARLTAGQSVQTIKLLLLR